MKCEKCGADKPDVLRRMSPRSASNNWPGMEVVDPALCVACTSEAPGRQWMRRTA